MKSYKDKNYNLNSLQPQPQKSGSCVSRSDFCADPDEIYGGKIHQGELQAAYVEWLAAAKNWTTFVTLTFKRDTGFEAAQKDIKKLIFILNQRTIGKNFHNKVKHSYFSYAYGIEIHREFVPHFHIIMDNYINYKLLHGYWKSNHGFAWIDKTLDNKKTVGYISKYVYKGGEVDLYLRDREFIINL